MHRKYLHIKEYEKELHELRIYELTLRGVGKERLVFNREQVKGFFRREKNKLNSNIFLLANNPILKH